MPHLKAAPFLENPTGLATRSCWKLDTGIAQEEHSHTRKHRERWDMGIGGRGARFLPLPTKEISVGAGTTSQKCPIPGGHLGKLLGFRSLPVPSLPSINPKAIPSLVFLLYGFVLREGREESPNQHSQESPLWDLFLLGKTPGSSSPHHTDPPMLLLKSPHPAASRVSHSMGFFPRSQFPAASGPTHRQHLNETRIPKIPTSSSQKI